MKLLVYADLQATDGSESCFNNPSKRLQDWRVRRFFEVLHEIYVDCGCGGLIDLGDTTDDRSSIPVPTIDAILAGLAPFDGWNLKLIGNHEQYTRDASIHVGKLFDGKFKVVDKCQVFKAPDSDALIVCASFPGNYTELDLWLKHTAQQYRGRKLILFGHFQVIGSQLSSGIATEGVPSAALAGYTMGLLGHVHRPQAVAKSMWYVGSPFQQNFGEAGEAKRVAILDTETRAVTWVSMADYGFPVYHTVTASEFVGMVSDNEDRYHVVLGSQADTELLYGHTHCNRATTEYSYTNANSEATVKPESWSFESVLTRWLDKNDPKTTGIELSAAEMHGIGMQIANGNN